MLELYINGKKCDLSLDNEISLSKSFVARSREEFSYSFTLPRTMNNCEILNFIGNINVSNKFRYLYYAQLYKNSCLIFDGGLYVDYAGMDFFDVNLVSTKASAIEDIFGDSLVCDVRMDDNRYSVHFKDPYMTVTSPATDKDYSESYQLNKTIKPGSDPTTAKNWFMPYALYGQPFSVRNTSRYDINKSFQSNKLYDYSETPRPTDESLLLPFAEQQLLPMFNVKGMVRSLFENAGYKCDGNFFDDNNIFSYLYESFSGTYKDFVERDNQKFTVKMTMGDPVKLSGLSGKKVSYNPLLNRNSSETPSIVYKSTKYWDAARVKSFEVGTPRDVDNGDYGMVKTDPKDFSKYIKVMKSGWYSVSMDLKAKTDINTLISRNNELLPIDFGNLDRCMWEFQLVDRSAQDKLYSNILGLGSAVTNDYINLDKHNFEYRGTLMNSPNLSANPHYVSSDDVNTSLGYVIQTPDTYDASWIAHSMMMQLPKQTGAAALDPIKGDENIFNAFSFIDNKDVFEVDDKSLVCGFRFGNYQYNNRETINPGGVPYQEQNKNRNPYVLLMNLPDMSDKPYGVTANGFMDNVYKLGSNNTWSLLSLYKQMDKANVYETGTHRGRTAIAMVGSSGYSSCKKFAIESMNPSGIIPLDELSETNHYSFNRRAINKDYFDSDLVNRMSSVVGHLNPEVNNQNKDNLTAIDSVDEMEVSESKFIVWLERGVELEMRVAQPALFNGSDPDDEDSYVPVDAEVSMDFTLEYIGTSREGWKPQLGDNLSSRRASYMHQYMDPELKCSDYISGVVDLFDLKVNIDDITKTVRMEYFSSDYPKIVDITRYTDFDKISFTDNGRPGAYVIRMQDNTTMVDGNKGVSVKSTGGYEEAAITNVKYNVPSTMEVNIQYGLTGRTTIIGQQPILSEKEVFDKVTPTTDTYNFSGSKTPSLYFYSGRLLNGWNTKWIEPYDSATYTNYSRCYPLMSTIRDGVNLKDPTTIIDRFYNIDRNNSNLVAEAYIPYNVFGEIDSSTLIRLDSSLYKCVKIDNYDVDTGSCEITLTEF